MISIFTSARILPVSSFCHTPFVLFYKSSVVISRLSLYSRQVEANNSVAARTSAAGMPSGGRHCNSTSCSRETSFPRGSCSNDFFRSEEREKVELLRHEYKSTRAHMAMLVNMAVPRNVNNDLFKLDNVITISTI